MKFVLTFLCSVSLLVSTATFAAPGAAPSGWKPNSESLALNERGGGALRAGDMVGAEKLFAQAVAADSGNLTAVYNLAGAYLTNKKENAAIDLLTRYTSEGTNDPGIYARLGDAYFGSKKVKEAVASYEKSYEIDPSFPGVAARLSTVYALSNRLPDAEKMLRSAVALEPKNPEYLSNFASILLARGKVDESIDFAKRALQVKPIAGVYVTLGNAYESKKEWKSALTSFEKAAALGDERPEIKQKINELTSKVG